MTTGRAPQDAFPCGYRTSGQIMSGVDCTVCSSAADTRQTLDAGRKTPAVTSPAAPPWST
ncbi:hypothetical protein ACGFWE_00290 [Streptomyces sp. NPDC048523]|uniref:hypothetical protein n=1 Tax=Streptomyces sp. NPDC048523 TaxID=3365567 RepID=UPI003711DEDB